MDYGLSDYIDIHMVPYAVSAIAGLIYAFLYFKKITKMKSGYYGIVFSSIRAVFLVPFWGFLILLSIYILNPDFRDLVDYYSPRQSIPQKTVAVKNDTPTEVNFLLLRSEQDSTIEKDKIIYRETWRYAEFPGSKTMIPTFSVAPFAERTIYFYCPEGTKKVYLRLLTEIEDEWKTAVPSRVLDITGGLNYIFVKDLARVKNEKIKPTPHRKNIEYFGFFLLGFSGALYHLLAALSLKSKSRTIAAIVPGIIAAGCLWMIFNYGSRIWFAYFV